MLERDSVGASNYSRLWQENTVGTLNDNCLLQKKNIIGMCGGNRLHCDTLLEQRVRSDILGTRDPCLAVPVILKQLPGDDSSPFTAVVCVRHATTAEFIHVDTLSRVINLFHCAMCVCVCR